ncbi:hypothetical protein V5799_013210 [Amblyomma americanum]|uniref:Peptidase M13 C-terminal domain-containing protein n=1 Tax=Amblyomma americanum TaxID=6943 RepID=A0AAQ4E6K5_AMBAM
MIRALKRKLVNTPWFKDPLRTVALRKAKRFRIVVGYPKEFYKNSEVEALYAEYPDVGEDFIKAYLQIKRLLAHRGLKGNETKYLEISLPNASYQFGRHLITINVGMMHPPFYIVGSPAAINYGAIGQVLCHEVMHAFDVLGITKDHRGLRIKVNDTETMQEYEKRVLCLRRSYQRAESELRARSLAHKTDSEGLADYAGILLAYDAFRELPFRNRTQTVPSVGLNAEQTFFVAHCIKWCQEDKTSRVREDQALYWNLRSRCIVPLQNMPEFANAFSCKPGDYMNPAERCEFW